MVTFLLSAGFIVTLLFGPAPGIGPFNKKPKNSVGAVYKSSINSRLTSPAIPSILSLLNAESIVGKSPPLPIVYVPAANGSPSGFHEFYRKRYFIIIS